MCRKGMASMNGQHHIETEDANAGARGGPRSEDGAIGRARECGHDYYYLTPSAAAAIPEFKYSGTDLSLIYKHALSPLAQFLVDRATPRTTAPNTITFAGLCLMFTSYCVVWYHCPNLDEGRSSPSSVPRWIFAYNCASMLIYQTLDNMDGKQARRTGASSPLGLLFDHGCDAVNSIFGSANWIAAMALSTSDDALAIWVLVIIPMAAFYVTTWEEFFTGRMVLPIINGPSEGLLMGASLSLTSAVLGPEFWHGTHFHDSVLGPFVRPLLPGAMADLIPDAGVRNCDVMAVVTVLAFVQEYALKTAHVCRRYGAGSVLNQVPLLFLGSAALFVGRSDPSILVRRPRTCFHIAAGLFTEMVTQLMLDHMSLQEFNPLRPCLAPLALLVGLARSGALPDGATDDLLLAYAVGVWVYLLLKMRLAIHEICSVLGIWCFDIVTPRRAAPGAALPADGLRNGPSDVPALNGPAGSAKMLKVS